MHTVAGVCNQGINEVLLNCTACVIWLLHILGDLLSPHREEVASVAVASMADEETGEGVAEVAAAPAAPLPRIAIAESKEDAPLTCTFAWACRAVWDIHTCSGGPEHVALLHVVLHRVCFSGTSSKGPGVL